MKVHLLPALRKMARGGIIHVDDLQPLAKQAIEKWKSRGGGAWAASHHIPRSDGGIECVAVMAVSGDSGKPECFGFTTEDEPAYQAGLEQVAKVAKRTKGYKRQGCHVLDRPDPPSWERKGCHEDD